MDDKELLTLAAKAAGIEYDPARSEPHPVSGAWWGLWLVYHREPTEFDRRYWNPRTDDGDALRLSVKLGLESYHTFNDDHWCVFVGYPVNQRIVYVSEPYELDEYAATRRAIVRAAAEIGRGM